MFARLSLLALLALAPLPATASQASGVPGVLVLFSDERAIPANGEAETALREALGLPRVDIEYSAEFLDSTRFRSPDADAIWRDFLGRKYAGHDIRVVVAAGTAAMEFLDRHHDELFPGVPVVVTAVSANLMRGRTLPPDFISLPFTYDLAGTIRAARLLQPAATEIVVAVGTTEDDRAWEALVQRDVPAASGGLPIRILRNLALEDILKQVAALTPSSIGLYVPINRDGAGRARIPRETFAAIAAVSGAPYYSVFSTMIGAGVVGGQVTTYASMGHWTAGIIRQILDGAAPSSTSLSEVPSSLVVDWRAMQRWGLDESRLPAGREVRFREASLWEQYRWQIVGVVALVALQAFLIVSLMIQRRRREIAEAASHAHLTELAHLTRVSLMGELAASLAHELNQPLTAILSNAQAAQRFLRMPEPDLDTVREIVDDIAADDRRAGDVISRLRASMKKGEPRFQTLRCHDVVGGVLRLVRNELMLRQVSVVVECPDDLPGVRGDRVQLQQVLLNLILNAADAMRDAPVADRRITISARRGESDTVQATVSDRGRGIPADQISTVFEPFFTTKREGLGLGLAICRTIVEEHHGRLWAINNPDRGASFHLTLPAA